MWRVGRWWSLKTLRHFTLRKLQISEGYVVISGAVEFCIPRSTFPFQARTSQVIIRFSVLVGVMCFTCSRGKRGCYLAGRVLTSPLNRELRIALDFSAR